MNTYVINGYNHTTMTTYYAFINAVSYDHAIETFTSSLEGITDCINVDLLHEANLESYTTIGHELTGFNFLKRGA